MLEQHKQERRFKQSKQWIVVTDLDGSLLDHHDYQWNAAKPVLSALQTNHIPVIFNTSKTQAESLQLQHQMFGLAYPHPMIVENGGAVVIPNGGILPAGIKTFGPANREMKPYLSQLQTRFQFSPITDMTLQEVVTQTGLDEERAQQARQRSYTEPIVWLDTNDQLEAFKTELNQHQLTLIKGGRFFHVLGSFDKGLALQWLTEQYAGVLDAPPKVLALGDGNNDVPMLEVADYSVLIKSPINPWPELSASLASRVIKTEAVGPQGWAEAVEQWLATVIVNTTSVKTTCVKTESVKTSGCD